ncbi:MAG: hypothetical protein JRJ38_16020 [Deltaproteobacteria bacterium]|nr:hypothetical protein [Deltaproteobacteria bacterium]
MQLKPSTEQALYKWLGPDTWHTSNDFDMNRFYDFVDQYQKDYGFTIDEAALREVIERKVKAGVNEHIREIIREHISLAYRILDFLKHTGR